MIVCVEEPEIIGQLFGSRKIPSVHVRIGGSVGSVIGFSVDDGHHAALQGCVELIRDVIGAQRVLKGEHKFVIFSQQLHAL